MTPTPPQPPAHLLDGVGPGEFWQTGREMVALIRQEARLRPDDRILDIGCGLGRVAWPLSEELDERGTYDGLDTLDIYIDWCRNGLGLDPDRFRFHLVDVYSSMYNPAGKLKPETLRFPFDNQSFSLVIATSLFTHLSAAATVNYLTEIARMLEKGGRVFCSFFVLDDASREVLRAGKTYPEFTTEIEHGLLADPGNPETAVAFDAEWLHRVFLDVGYTVEVYATGSWRRQFGPSYQDIVVARK